MSDENDCNTLAAPTCTIFGFLLGLAASCCYVFVTVTPCWFVSYAEASISPYENCYGLWKFCSSTGLCGKWLSGSLLGAHGTQRIVCRGLMISACLLSSVALVLNLFGMKCVQLFRLSIKTKERLVRWSAAVWTVSGSFALVSSTWYGLDVMNSAWEKGEARELSDGIFVGWGSAAFSFAAAVFLWLASAVWRRERKLASRRRDSVLTTVAAAYVASRSGSGVSVGCCCHLPPKLLPAHGCGKHGARPPSDLQVISESRFPEELQDAHDTAYATRKMTYM